MVSNPLRLDCLDVASKLSFSEIADLLSMCLSLNPVPKDVFFFSSLLIFAGEGGAIRCWFRLVDCLRKREPLSSFSPKAFTLRSFVAAFFNEGFDGDRS